MVALKIAAFLAVVVLVGLIRRRLMRPFPRSDSDRLVVGAFTVLLFIPTLAIASGLGVLSPYLAFASAVLFIATAEIPR